MRGKRLKQLEDDSAWQNKFYKEITSRIDETIFSPMYSDATGRPNASVRQLVAMLILKEGNDWTDEQLMEACSFNLLVMRALGLVNLDDQAPCRATYYNFKVSMAVYEQRHGVNLLDKAFRALTNDQVLRYKVNGATIRMDTKLLHSNVAKMTRLQLALGVVAKFYKSLSQKDVGRLYRKDKELLGSIVSQSPEQYTFRLDKQSAARQLNRLGHLVAKLINIFSGQKTAEYELLCRLWQDHFELVKQDDDQDPTPRPKDMSKGKGTTIQSPHDPQATYRNKPGSKRQVITGYVSNIVDCCSTARELNLIVDVQTAVATTSDNKFFKPAIKRSRGVLANTIENVLSDGGYNSEANARLSTSQPGAFNWYITALQGAYGYYDFEQIQEDVYQVTDRRTGVVQITKRTEGGKYRIEQHNTVKPYRYLDQKTIDNYFRRQAIASYPDWVKGKRANGESTIHQLFCKLNGLKTKYRGLHKHHNYVLARSFWVNFRRISAYLIKSTETAMSIIRMKEPDITIHTNILFDYLRKQQDQNSIVINQIVNPG